jgi:hypothetical protein
MPDSVAVPGQEVPRRFTPVLIVQAQFNRFGAAGIKSKVYPASFSEGSEPAWVSILDHALECNRFRRCRELW